MMRFLHEAGLLLLPFCGWLAGDLVQSRRNERLDALQQTIALLQRIRQEILYRRHCTASSAGRGSCRKRQRRCSRRRRSLRP